ncbi:MAG: MauE/DoxX family redox-associated membrane protein [Dermatophilaceae bacterium]
MSPLVVPGLLLAAVLALSGVAKLASPEANADAFRSLRVPDLLTRLRGPLLLPYAELLLALALLVTPGTAYILVASIGLLLMLVYTAVVARALTFAEPVSCSCFGRLGLGAITRLTVMRNLLLALVAGLAVADAVRQSRSIAARLLDADRHAWGWLAIVALAVATTGLIAHSTAAPVPAPPPVPRPEPFDRELDYVRQPIPFGRLRTPDERPITLRELAATAPRLLVFLNLGCGSCLRTMEALPSFIERNPEVSVHPVFHDGVNREAIPDWMDYLLDEGAEIMHTFGVATPSAVLLGADGLLAGGPVIGQDAVSEFLDDISEELVATRVEAGLVAPTTSGLAPV